MSKWNPQILVEAAKKSGVKFEVDSDWLTCPDPYPMTFTPTGIVWHHTACGTLSRGNMPSLPWCRKPGVLGKDARACHIVLGRDGSLQIIAGKGAYHAGAGGPLKVNGTVIPKDLGNRFLLGVEIEAASSTRINKKDVQTPKVGVNPSQFDALARYCAALFDILGWDTEAAIRHKDWTSRKIDVGLPLEMIRSAIDVYRVKVPVPVKPPVKPPVVAEKPKPKPPAAKPAVTVSKVQPTKKNGDVKIVQEALKKEVGLQIPDSALGTFNALTKTAYLKFQKSLGYKGADADGIPGKASLTALGKKHGFTVKTP